MRVVTHHPIVTVSRGNVSARARQAPLRRTALGQTADQGGADADGASELLGNRLASVGEKPNLTHHADLVVLTIAVSAI